MREEFIKKFNNSEYISQYLYERTLNDAKDLIPIGFNIEEYNDAILNKLYLENKEYFENMYKGIDDNIHLDEEQCKAIIADEKYSLIVAGAGTGKTTTMTSKVKYLVDKKNANPERILVMSYTRKATEEIASRIQDYFGLPVNVTTFHSLGYEYIKQIFNTKKCLIVDKNKKEEIMLKFFNVLFKDKTSINEINENFHAIKSEHGFIFSKHFMNNYQDYDTYEEYLECYINDKLSEAKSLGLESTINTWIEKQLLKDEHIKTIGGENVKSAGEMIIANFLYKHGIEYSYEEIYQELMENRSIYKPDFTIEYGGEKIYLEYYGLDNSEYNSIKLKKQKYHKEHNNKYIEIERINLSRIEKVLEEKLKEFNIVYKDRTDEQIYCNILRQNPLSQVYPFLNYLYDSVENRKSSTFRDNAEIVQKYIDTLTGYEKETTEIQYKYIRKFDLFYSNELYGGDIYYFDFEDLLYYAVKYLEKLTIDTKLIFDYIIIDEYQDISKIKYELTYKTAKRNDAKVYAVGDDWQSIYAFSGARIEYIYKFKEFFKGARFFKITNTYRNSQELIDYSGEFIMKNPSQITKQLSSEKHIENPIVFKKFDFNDPQESEIETLKELILEIHKKNPEHNILILGRTNRSINRLLDDEELLDDIGTKITFKSHEDINIEGMTIHKSKGLTFDEVIIVGLNKNFPSDKNRNDWYKDIYRNKPIEEQISFAEERRVFYVGLTRTKNKVYLLVNSDPKMVSPFVLELKDIIEKKSHN